MIRYCRGYNGLVSDFSTLNAVPSATNTDVTNDSFDDYFQPETLPFSFNITAEADSDTLAVCVGFGSDVVVTIESIDYTVNKLGTVIIPVQAVQGDVITVVINSSSIMALNFCQLAVIQTLSNDYESGFLYSQLVNARKNTSVESFGSPSGITEIRRSIPVTLKFPNMLTTDLDLISDFKSTTELKVADFDGIHMVIFDIIISTNRHAQHEDLVSVSAKYKVWSN